MDSSSYAYDSTGTVSAVFLSKENADRACDALIRRGYSKDEISVLMSDETLNKHFNESQGSDQSQSKSDSKIGLGTALGGTTGAITGILFSLSMISIPGLGIAIAGPLVAGLTGAAAGAITGGTIGSLMGSKIPKEHTDSMEGGIKEGGIIISVNPRNLAESEAIIQEFKNNHGQDILGNDGYSHLD